MKALMGKCLKCNAVSTDMALLKFRVQLLTRTYERCNVCGKWAFHKVFFQEIKRGGNKE